MDKNKVEININIYLKTIKQYFKNNIILLKLNPNSQLISLNLK